jgi:phasin family protein
MSDSESPAAEASAEKAYAKASETTAPAQIAALKAAAVAPESPAAPAMAIPSVKPKPATKPAKAPSVKAAKPSAKVTAKPAAKRVALKPVAPAKPKVAKLAKRAPVAAPASRTFTAPTIPAFAKTKETTMNMNTKITEGFGTAFGEAQTKAKEAFEKSSAMFGDYAAFAKGNVEAVVESGKILAEGLQDMGTNLVAEGRSAFEIVSSDIKEMAAAKSPTDLIQLQSEMFRKSFDSAVAYGSKNTEAMLKIASDAFAPLSSRVTFAVEKVRSAAI